METNSDGVVDDDEIDYDDLMEISLTYTNLFSPRNVFDNREECLDQGTVFEKDSEYAVVPNDDKVKDASEDDFKVFDAGSRDQESEERLGNSDPGIQTQDETETKFIPESFACLHQKAKQHEIQYNGNSNETVCHKISVNTDIGKPNRSCTVSLLNLKLTTTNDGYIQCLKCKFVSRNATDIERHLISFNCDKVSDEIAESSHLDVSLKTEVEDLEEIKDGFDLNKPEAGLQICGLCRQSFRDYIEYLDHTYLCQFKAASSVKVEVNNGEVKTEDGSNFNIPSPESLTRGKKALEITGIFQNVRLNIDCEKCGEQFASELHLEKHAGSCLRTKTTASCQNGRKARPRSREDNKKPDDESEVNVGKPNTQRKRKHPDEPSVPNKKLRRSAGLDRNDQQEPSRVRGKYPCSLCQRSFQSKELLGDHITLEHVEVDQSGREDGGELELSLEAHLHEEDEISNDHSDTEMILEAQLNDEDETSDNQRDEENIRKKGRKKSKIAVKRTKDRLSNRQSIANLKDSNAVTVPDTIKGMSKKQKKETKGIHPTRGEKNRVKDMDDAEIGTNTVTQQLRGKRKVTKRTLPNRGMRKNLKDKIENRTKIIKQQLKEKRVVTKRGHTKRGVKKNLKGTDKAKTVSEVDDNGQREPSRVWSKYPCSSCQKSFQTKETLGKHIAIAHEKVDKSGMEDEEELELDFEELSHVEDEISDDQSFFELSLETDEISDDESDLESSIRKRRDKRNNSVKVLKGKQSNKQSKANLKDSDKTKSVSEVDDNGQREPKRVRSKYPCSLCRRSFQTKETLGKHITKAHEKVNQSGHITKAHGMVDQIGHLTMTHEMEDQSEHITKAHEKVDQSGMEDEEELDLDLEDEISDDQSESEFSLESEETSDDDSDVESSRRKKRKNSIKVLKEKKPNRDDTGEEDTKTPKTVKQMLKEKRKVSKENLSNSEEKDNHKGAGAEETVCKRVKDMLKNKINSKISEKLAPRKSPEPRPSQSSDKPDIIQSSAKQGNSQSSSRPGTSQSSDRPQTSQSSERPRTSQSSDKPKSVHWSDGHRTFQCFFENCQKVFTCVNQFKQHLKQEVQNQNNKMRAGQMLTHRIGAVELQKQLQALGVSLLIFTCRYLGCGHMFLSVEEVQYHYMNTHTAEVRKHICDREGCNRSFESINELRSHVIVDHAVVARKPLTPKLMETVAIVRQRQKMLKNGLVQSKAQEGEPETDNVEIAAGLDKGKTDLDINKTLIKEKTYLNISMGGKNIEIGQNEKQLSSSKRKRNKSIDDDVVVIDDDDDDTYADSDETGHEGNCARKQNKEQPSDDLGRSWLEDNERKSHGMKTISSITTSKSAGTEDETANTDANTSDMGTHSTDGSQKQGKYMMIKALLASGKKDEKICDAKTDVNTSDVGTHSTAGSEKQGKYMTIKALLASGKKDEKKCDAYDKVIGNDYIEAMLEYNEKGHDENETTLEMDCDDAESYKEDCEKTDNNNVDNTKEAGSNEQKCDSEDCICKHQNCGEIFDTKEQLKEHVQEKHICVVLNIYRCFDCKEVFRTVIKLQLHAKVDHGVSWSGDIIPEYACLSCNLIFLTKSFASEHYIACRKLTFIQTLLNNPGTESDPPSNNSSSCVENTHVKPVGDGDENSDVPNNYVEIKTGVSENNEEVATPDNLPRFSCVPCLCFFPTKEKLDWHKLAHHSRFACGRKGCVRTFLSQGLLLEHFKSHDKPTPLAPAPRRTWMIKTPQHKKTIKIDHIFTCRLCPFQTINYQDLQHHKSVQHNLGAFCCQSKDCFQSFNTKKDLIEHDERRHMVLDPALLPYKCRVTGCSKAFLHLKDRTHHVCDHIGPEQMKQKQNNTEVKTKQDKADTKQNRDKTETEQNQDKTEAEQNQDKTEIDQNQDKTETNQNQDTEQNQDKAEIEQNQDKTETEQNQEKVETEQNQDRTEIEQNQEKSETEQMQDKRETTDSGSYRN